jgi:hypothetical protein
MDSIPFTRSNICRSPSRSPFPVAGVENGNAGLKRQRFLLATETSEPAAEGMDDFRAAPLDVEAAAAVETVFVFQPFVSQFGDLDGPCLAERFQAAREVYGVAPKVVGEFPVSNDARDDGTGADA